MHILKFDSAHSQKLDGHSEVKGCTFSKCTDGAHSQKSADVSLCTFWNRMVRILKSRMDLLKSDGVHSQSARMVHILSSRLLSPFTGLLAGLKFAGLSPAKCPATSPAKKFAPEKSKLGPPNSSLLALAIFARPYYEFQLATWIPVYRKRFPKVSSLLNFLYTGRHSHKSARRCMSSTMWLKTWLSRICVLFNNSQGRGNTHTS